MKPEWTNDRKFGWKTFGQSSWLISFFFYTIAIFCLILNILDLHKISIIVCAGILIHVAIESCSTDMRFNRVYENTVFISIFLILIVNLITIEKPLEYGLISSLILFSALIFRVMMSADALLIAIVAISNLAISYWALLFSIAAIGVSFVIFGNIKLYKEENIGNKYPVAFLIMGPGLLVYAIATLAMIFSVV